MGVSRLGFQTRMTDATKLHASVISVFAQTGQRHLRGRSHLPCLFLSFFERLEKHQKVTGSNPIAVPQGRVKSQVNPQKVFFFPVDVTRSSSPPGGLAPTLLIFSPFPKQNKLVRTVGPGGHRC